MGDHTREMDVTDLTNLREHLGNLQKVEMFGYSSETEEFLDIMKGFKILKDMAKYVMEKIGKMEQTNTQSGNDVLTGKKTEHMITTAGNNTKHILDSLDDNEEDEFNSKEVDIQFETEKAIVTMEDLSKTVCIEETYDDEDKTDILNSIPNFRDNISVNPPTLESIRRDENGKSVYQCGQCNKSFVNLKRVNNHDCSKRMSKVTCPLCSKVIGNRSINKHIELHTNQETFSCQVCQKNFRSKSGFDGHLCRDQSDRECKLCDKSFKKPCFLLKHNKSVHEKRVIKERPKVTSCKFCELDCKAGIDVRKHMLLEHMDRATRCSFCNDPFFTRGGMSKHIKEHLMLSKNEIKQE